MNRLWWCLPLVVSVAWAQSSQRDAEIEKTIMALENQWLESERANKPEMAAPLMADRMLATGAGGVENKSQDLAGTPKYTSAENSDMQVRVFGDTAIATGMHTSSGTSKEGKPFSRKYRFTDTWVKMPDGKWQCVATANSAPSR